MEQSNSNSKKNREDMRITRGSARKKRKRLYALFRQKYAENYSEYSEENLMTLIDAGTSEGN